MLLTGIDRKGMRRGAKKVKAASGLGRGGTEKERSRERARANPPSWDTAHEKEGAGLISAPPSIDTVLACYTGDPSTTYHVPDGRWCMGKDGMW